MTPTELAHCIDHTLLRPEATPEQIDVLCDEGVRFEFGAVCVNPIYVRRAARRLDERADAAGSAFRTVVASVVGFPLGATTTDAKSDEARRAVDDGAMEVDMVVHLGSLIAGDLTLVRRDIESVAHAVHGSREGTILKVILETTILSEAQIIQACRCCAEGEADFVKTSTGFHASGGARVEHVRLLHRHASPLKVKAAGGIRSLESTMAMLGAGADRIGTSAGVIIIEAARRARS